MSTLKNIKEAMEKIKHSDNTGERHRFRNDIFFIFVPKLIAEVEAKDQCLQQINRVMGKAISWDEEHDGLIEVIWDMGEKLKALE